MTQEERRKAKGSRFADERGGLKMATEQQYLTVLENR